MMGSHDTGHDRSQERRTGQKGHVTRNQRFQRRIDGAGCSNMVGCKVKAEYHREIVLSDRA